MTLLKHDIAKIAFFLRRKEYFKNSFGSDFFEEAVSKGVEAL